MSWASPRSIPGAFGLNRFSNGRFGMASADHNHKHGSSFWSKFCYACSIVILAAILWLWAISIHDIYKLHSSYMAKTFYMIGATVVASVLFVIIVCITMTIRPPRRPSTATTAEEDHNEHKEQKVITICMLCCVCITITNLYLQKALIFAH